MSCCHGFSCAQVMILCLACPRSSLATISQGCLMNAPEQLSNLRPVFRRMRCLLSCPIHSDLQTLICVHQFFRRFLPAHRLSPHSSNERFTTCWLQKRFVADALAPYCIFFHLPELTLSTLHTRTLSPCSMSHYRTQAPHPFPNILLSHPPSSKDYDTYLLVVRAS